MASERGTILVAGVTGKQGGAVVRHLRANGFAVRGITRDPDAAKARPLREMGVELVRGDLTDRESLNGLFDGVAGVFAMATPFEAGLGAELAQGKILGEGAKAAGVRHYVYSSVGGADRDSGVPHFESKWAVENHLRELELPLTVVRPVWLFENLTGWSMQPADGGYVISMPLPPQRTLQGVAVDDIGGFVALAFLDPAEWIGREFELAGDELTVSRYAAVVEKHLGTQVRYVQLPWDALRDRDEDLYLMYRFFDREGYRADIDALRARYPGLHTFGRWLGEGGLSRLSRAA